MIDKEKALAIGDVLRNARENKKLTLEDVSAILKIRRLYLNNLEMGNIESIPGFVYQKLYLKTYCNFLEMPEEEFPILPIASNENKPDSIEKQSLIQKLRAQRKASRLVLAISAVTVIALIIYNNF